MPEQRNHADRILLSGMLLVFAILVLISGAALLHAHNTSEAPNKTATLGGDVVYCADANGQPASSYEEGGIQVANSRGEPLFLVPVEIIKEVPRSPAVDTLIAEGTGSFGTLSLYRLATGQFELAGIDEHGEHFIYVWYECQPAGRVAESVS